MSETIYTDEVSDFKPGGSNPKQYGLPEGATELQDLIEYRGMNFAIGNIFKACYRMGTCSHSDELRDLRKILWFADREIKRLEKDEKVRKAYFKASKVLVNRETGEKASYNDILRPAGSVIPPDFDSIVDEVYGLGDNSVR